MGCWERKRLPARLCWEQAYRTRRFPGLTKVTKMSSASSNHCTSSPPSSTHQQKDIFHHREIQGALSALFLNPGKGLEIRNGNFWEKSRPSVVAVTHQLRVFRLKPSQASLRETLVHQSVYSIGGWTLGTRVTLGIWERPLHLFVLRTGSQSGRPWIRNLC
jgi:hypothetical protein